MTTPPQLEVFSFLFSSHGIDCIYSVFDFVEAPVAHVDAPLRLRVLAVLDHTESHIDDATVRQPLATDVADLV